MMHMMRTIAVLGLAVLAGCGQPVTGEPAQLAPDPTPLTKRESTLEQQERCFEMSRKRFIELGYTRNDGGPAASFENYYNSRFDRCFMKVFEFSGKYTATTVIDPHRGVQYARYARFSGAPDLGECELVLASGEEKKCDTKEDFDQQITLFMGDLKLEQ